MRNPVGLRRLWTLALLAMAVSAATASAQGRVTPEPYSTIVQLPEPRSVPNTGVSFIASAIPFTHVRVRVDSAWNYRRPSRAEFFWPKSGIIPSPGPPLPEINLDYQQLSTYVEYAFANQFSIFMDQKLRWVDPDVNENEGGIGDMQLGLKWAAINYSGFTGTLLFQAYLPTANDRALGTRHVTLEPGVLFNYPFLDLLLLEGELRFWLPVGGTDFAGNIVNYGLGLTYGQRSPGQIWLTPVAEVVGWTVLDGKELVVHPGGALEINNAEGQTIVNMNLGVRLGLGDTGDFYTGYSRALTGRTWYQDMFRFEFRMYF
jgi:hypothetical protein